jgi:hypothetical protein
MRIAAVGCAILSGVTRPGPAARPRRPGHPGPGGASDRRAGDRPLPYGGSAYSGHAGRSGPGPGERPAAIAARAAGSRRPAAGAEREPRPAGGSRRGGRRAGRRPDPAERFAPPYRIVTLRTADGPLRARIDPRDPRRRPLLGAGRGHPSGALDRFVRTWGWRAYALPVLTVLTVVCGVDLANGPAAALPLRHADTAAPAPPAAAAPPPARANPTPARQPTPTGIYVDDGGTGTARPLPPTALPAGGPYALRGSQRWDVVPGTSKVYGSGPLHRFTVEVEAGVSVDGPAFAAAVERTLSDAHSWTNGGRASLQRIDSGVPDFRISLTASLTVRKLCGYDLPYETSCYNGDQARVVLNDARWVRGAVAYAGDLAGYRLYVVNHEVGHALGNGHVACPRNGALAPVMMQQTLGISTPGVGTCKPNPWPYP